MGVRATLKEAVARVVMGDRLKELKRTTNLVIDFYERRQYIRTPEQFMETMSEVDPRLVDLMLRRINQGTGFLDYTNETIRREIVTESREAYVWDPVTGRIVDLYTDFGFAINIEIVPQDSAAIEPWGEFFTATRNSAVLGTRSISILSQEVLTAGELFFVMFISKTDGQSTLRYIKTEEIVEIITLPDDGGIPLFYIREYSPSEGSVPIKVAYPDWRATPAELLKAKLPDDIKLAHKERTVSLGNDTQAGTDVKMLHAAHRVKSGSLRGFPLMTAGVDWARAYRNFLQDRAAVARAVATFVDKLSTKGGSRAKDQLIATLQSGLVGNPSRGYDDNPPPAAGSTWVDNEQLTRDRMPLTTGAGDAEKDGSGLLGQAGLAGGVYLHWLGRGPSYRLATATAMELPVLRAFNRYQLFWSSVWSDIGKIVLTAQELYNRASYKTKEVDVNLDPVIQIAIEEIAKTGDMLTDMVDRGMISVKQSIPIAVQLLRISLGKIGVTDTTKMLDIKAERETGGAMQTKEDAAWKSMSLFCEKCNRDIKWVVNEMDEYRIDSGGITCPDCLK